MHIIFYGPEGSGKTTQGRLVAQKLKIPHLVSGDLIRKYAKVDKGIMGEICREALAKGFYVADSEMFVLWKRRFKEPDVDNGWVIDGFPRNMDQAKFLEEKLIKYKKEEDVVFFLKVREKVSVERLTKRARRNPDGTLSDTPQLIRERLRRYKIEEANVLDFYKKKGVLQAIDGEKKIEAIHQDIMVRIKKICQKKK